MLARGICPVASSRLMFSLYMGLIFCQMFVLIHEIFRQSKQFSWWRVFLKIFMLEYFLNEMEVLAEIGDFVSGEHGSVRCGSSKP